MMSYTKSKRESKRLGTVQQLVLLCSHHEKIFQLTTSIPKTLTCSLTHYLNRSLTQSYTYALTCSIICVSIYLSACLSVYLSIHLHCRVKFHRSKHHHSFILSNYYHNFFNHNLSSCIVGYKL